MFYPPEDLLLCPLLILPHILPFSFFASWVLISTVFRRWGCKYLLLLLLHLLDSLPFNHHLLLSFLLLHLHIKKAIPSWALIHLLLSFHSPLDGHLWFVSFCFLHTLFKILHFLLIHSTFPNPVHGLFFFIPQFLLLCTSQMSSNFFPCISLCYLTSFLSILSFSSMPFSSDVIT